MLQNRRLFFALASRSGFGAAISDAVVRSSITFIVFCNSVFADRIVMAASGLLLAAAACVILLSFAAGLRKSYWSGCMKAATVICQQIFSISALGIFLLKSASKSSSFFRFGVEIRFWSCNSCVYKLLCAVKERLCVKVSVCKRLPCVEALCVSVLCVNACCVWKLAVCKRFCV